MNLVELGLVAEMNLVELGLWWYIWTRIGGESVMEVDSDYHDGGGYVVYGSSDDDGGIWQR